MITITAVLRAKSGQETALYHALRAVAEHVAAHEPNTKGFYISQSIETPSVFTTYERFSDEAAKDLHNGSEAVARFFAKADTLIEGEVILHTCHEVFDHG